jgi:uncharacterized Zn finger protein
MSWYEYRPYVSAAQRRAQAAREVSKRLKKGLPVQPVSIEGRLIARTFWGKAWCENLEGYSDFENRLPRGRTYARNGSVVHLEIHKGRIEALVSGSELYDVRINIAQLPTSQWTTLKQLSAGKIGSLVELLQGKLSEAVMTQVTDRKNGLFPKPAEIEMRCSCLDYAGMCKHIAAVMYGIGNRLDSEPQLLFLLRGVDHLELISQTMTAPEAPSKRKGRSLASADLGAIFDIELEDDSTAAEPAPTKLKAPAARKPETSAATAATPKPAKLAKPTKAVSKSKPATKVKSPAKAAKPAPKSVSATSAKCAMASASKPKAKSPRTSIKSTKSSAPKVAAKTKSARTKKTTKG